MKKILYIIILLLMVCCTSQNAGIESLEYDWEALRDTLGLRDDCIFVKEVSPLYKDNNPYEFDHPETRVKTIFYQVFYDEEISDTIIHAVLRNNEIVYWGRNEASSNASSLIEWTIKNREKI